MLEGLQKALREMFLIGLVSGIVLFVAERHATYPDGIFSCLLIGLIYSPLVWAVYRLLRFMIIPLRS